MSLWSWWKANKREPVEPETGTSSTEPGVESLPSEPYVFECSSCGKVFEARRRRPLCPECDSANVNRVS